MEDLIIKNGPNIKIRKGIGIFMLLIAIIWGFIFIDSRKIPDLLQTVLWSLLGAYQLTEGFGLEKSYIQIRNKGLNIKWMNKIRPILIFDSEIENICLKKTEVIINRANKKPLRLKRNNLELKQMTEIYKLFMDYSKIRNLTLIRDF